MPCPRGVLGSWADVLPVLHSAGVQPGAGPKLFCPLACAGPTCRSLIAAARVEPAPASRRAAPSTRPACLRGSPEEERGYRPLHFQGGARWRQPQGAGHLGGRFMSARRELANVYSDDGSEFKREFKELMDFWDIEKQVTRGHAHFAERTIRTIKEAMLRRIAAGAGRRGQWHLMQTRAAARSRGQPRLRNNPARAHAARWSRKGSRRRRPSAIGDGKGESEPPKGKRTEQVRRDRQLRRQ